MQDENACVAMELGLRRKIDCSNCAYMETDNQEFNHNKPTGQFCCCSGAFAHITLSSSAGGVCPVVIGL